MADHKLLEIIRTFSPEEQEDFSLFLNSPYFVRGGSMEEMLRLYDCLIVAATDSENGIPEKSLVHATVFPEKAFSISRIDRVCGRLQQLIEQFLLTRFYARGEHEPQRELDLVRVYKSKGLASRFEKKLQKLTHEAVENPLESTEHYLFRYHLAKEEHDWRSTYNNARGDLAIPQLIENLQLFYSNELLDMLSRFLLQQKSGSLPDSEIIQIALDLSNHYKHYEKQSPLLQIRSAILDLFLTEEPSHSGFEKLFGLLEKHKKGLSKELLPEMYTFLRNYCSILINYGNNDLRIILHEIQKDNLDNGYFYYTGRITPFAMLNITRVAVILKKVEWARQFVEAHRYIILTDQDPDQIYRMNLALCFWGEENFEQVLQHISLTIKNHIYLLLSKRLELMAYYELRSNLLPYKIEAFRKFLERTASQKSSSMDWTQHYNFCKLLLQISQTTPKNVRRATSLFQRIKKINLVSERSWLLEKAMELA